MDCLWWRKKNSPYHQILLEDDDDDADTNVIARLNLSPPNRVASADCSLHALLQSDHSDDNCLFIVGGVMGKLKTSCALCRPHGDSTRYWVWIATPFAALLIFILLLLIFILPDYDDADDNDEVYTTVIICGFVVPTFFGLLALLSSERVHRTSELYKTSLQDFHTKTRAVISSFSDVLRDEGFFLSVVEPSAVDGSLEVVIERVGPLKSSLPAVTTTFQERHNPISAINATLVFIGLQGGSVPIDIWVFGALMLRLRLARTEHAQTSDRCKKWVLTPSICACGGVMNIVCSYRLPYSLLLVPVMILAMILCLLLARHFEEFVDAPAIHMAWGSAVAEISAIAEERHGQRLVYDIEPAGCYKLTKGVIRFTSVRQDEEEGEGADNLLTPATIV